MPKKKRRMIVKRRPAARRHKRKKLPAPAVTAIVKNRERNLNAQEIELLKTTVAKGTTDEEFLYFMTICRKHRIDPFTKQIYCIVWPTDGGRSHDLVIIMGIGGYRMTAARDHKDFGGTSAAVFTWPDEPMTTPAGRKIPESATVKALRKGGESAEATVYWEEFAPADLKTKRSDFWNKYPKHMLAKCAESHALRKAYPDLSDIYTEEEVSQRMQDFTPEGRQIHKAGVAPSGAVVDPYKAAKAAQKQILDAKLDHGHPPGSAAARNAEKAIARVEAEDARLAAAKNVTPKKEKAPKQKKIPAGATLLTGTIHNVVFGVTAEKKIPFLKLQINREWFTIWSKTLQEHFSAGLRMVGNVIECWTMPTTGIPNIEGLRRINDQYFADDGRTPIPREPGAEG